MLFRSGHQPHQDPLTPAPKGHAPSTPLLRDRTCHAPSTLSQKHIITHTAAASGPGAPPTSQVTTYSSPCSTGAPRSHRQDPASSLNLHRDLHKPPPRGRLLGAALHHKGSRLGLPLSHLLHPTTGKTAHLLQPILSAKLSAAALALQQEHRSHSQTECQGPTAKRPHATAMGPGEPDSATSPGTLSHPAHREIILLPPE